MKHVYGKRNRFLTYLRGIEAKLYRTSAMLFKTKQDSSPLKIIFCYPRFNTVEQLSNVLNKLAWAFPEDSKIEVVYSTDSSVDTENINTPDILKEQGIYLNKNSNIKKISITEEKTYLSKSSIIAIHNKKYRYSPDILPYLNKVAIVDPTYYFLTEANFWKFGYYNLLSAKEKEYYRKLSVNNYVSFKEKNKSKTKANLFLTGPSFSRYGEFSLAGDAINIVCNTIIKDTDFLEYIGGPDIIAFADPEFHFSSCNYAHEFRRLVVNTVLKYGSFIAVPLATVPLMLGNYPELKDKIIGLRRSDELVFPNELDLSAKPSGSILTFLMLPLATDLADEIYILGADGRGKKENYFWKHNEKVQMKELMSSVFAMHPSVFRDVSYKDHYAAHCAYMEKMILSGEAIGKKYFSLTESFVPVLQKRLMHKN